MDDEDRGAESLENLTEKREKKWQIDNAEPTQLSLEVRARPEMRDEKNPYIVGALKLKGEFHVRKDLHAGEQLTVQVADADGNVITAGVVEVGLPAFKDLKMKGGGIIGTERVHSAKIVEDV
jgi:hypothetical protein